MCCQSVICLGEYSEFDALHIWSWCVEEVLVMTECQKYNTWKAIEHTL